MFLDYTVSHRSEEHTSELQSLMRISYGYTGVEHGNEVYDKVLEQCRKDFEPKYKEEFEQQYRLVYLSLIHIYPFRQQRVWN